MVLLVFRNPQGTDFGYFAGGMNGSNQLVTMVDRVDYSNDTGTAVAKGPLTIANWTHGATGNASFGYFGGGSLLVTCHQYNVLIIPMILQCGRKRTIKCC